MAEYDFYDMATQGLGLLREGAEVDIHVRDRENLEIKSVRARVGTGKEGQPDWHKLHIYGRLGVSIPSSWYIEILKELPEEALATAEEEVAELDKEMSLGASETFKAPRKKR